MAVVAVTGGIAAGKTLVCSTLQSLGALIIDADVLAREAVAPGSATLQELVGRFGDSILMSDGALDRKALGSMVFGDSEKLEALNAIVHPEVRRLYELTLERVQREQPDAVVIYDVPLLAEARSREEFDAIVVVHAPAAQRISRLVELRGFSPEEASARVNSQASDATRLALASVVIDASTSEDETKRQTTELYKALKRLWPDRLADLPRSFPHEAS